MVNIISGGPAPVGALAPLRVQDESGEQAQANRQAVVSVQKGSAVQPDPVTVQLSGAYGLVSGIQVQEGTKVRDNQRRLARKDRGEAEELPYNAGGVSTEGEEPHKVDVEA